MPILESVSAAAVELTEVSSEISSELGSLEMSLETLEQTSFAPESIEAMKNLQVSEVDVMNESVQYPTINQHYEGTLHPDTGVPYERNTIELADGMKAEGVFPQFDAAAEVQLPEELYKESDAKQFNYANNELATQIEQNPEMAEQFTPEQMEQIQNQDTPDEYSWHHHEETGKLQLVDQQIHAETRHTGGKSIWGGGKDFR